MNIRCISVYVSISWQQINDRFKGFIAINIVYFPAAFFYTPIFVI